MAADKETLNAIHEKVARAYLALLNQMEGKCPECGHEIHAPLNPAVLGHINKFLAENDISALAVPESALDKIKKSGRLHLIKDYMEPHEKAVNGE
jgi:hypothetical protein